MIDILFIRHGATEGNLHRRYIGRTDEPLCAAGIAQAERLRGQNLFADCLFVSPLLRARQTAEIVFPQMPYALVEGLRETDFGRFEGKNADELSSDSAYQAWVDAMCLTPIPGGEAVADFKSAAARHLQKRSRPCRTACVRHLSCTAASSWQFWSSLRTQSATFTPIISETESALPARMTGRRCVSKALRAETRSVRIITGSTTPAECSLLLI